MSDETVKRLVERLGMQPHPEGGFYAETFRDRPEGGGRGALTQIYYLLPAGEISAWHRVTDATEVWHHYAGGPLLLSLADPDGRNPVEHRMGPDVLAGESPHVVVPPNWWQSARPLGEWALCGCTVGPAFEFSGFEMAPKGWAPGG